MVVIVSQRDAFKTKLLISKASLGLGRSSEDPWFLLRKLHIVGMCYGNIYIYNEIDGI